MVPRFVPSLARSTVTVLVPQLAIQRLVPSKAMPAGKPVVGNVPRFTPSLARSFVTFWPLKFVTQMLAPSKAKVRAIAGPQFGHAVSAPVRHPDVSSIEGYARGLGPYGKSADGRAVVRPKLGHAVAGVAPVRHPDVLAIKGNSERHLSRWISSTRSRNLFIRPATVTASVSSKFHATNPIPCSTLAFGAALGQDFGDPLVTAKLAVAP